MKDFEDTDREGTTMDSRKPLTAGEKLGEFNVDREAVPEFHASPVRK